MLINVYGQLKEADIGVGVKRITGNWVIMLKYPKLIYRHIGKCHLARPKKEGWIKLIRMRDKLGLGIYWSTGSANEIEEVLGPQRTVATF